MDQVTLFQIISIAGFSLAAIFFVTAIFIFIVLNIPSVIGDLSGKTAEKQIKAIRERNARTGDKQFRPSPINRERGTITEIVKKLDAQVSKGIKVEYSSNPSISFEEKGKTEQTSQYVNNFDTSTDLLDSNMIGEAQNTDILNETDIINADNLSSQTVILENDFQIDEQFNGTTVLSATEELKEFMEENKLPDNSTVFEIIRDITIVHTNEEIK